MTRIQKSLTRRLLRTTYGAILGILSAASVAQAPIVQPGAPGTQSRQLSAEEAINLADTSYTLADAQFMQDMIPHHQQAIEMAALVAKRDSGVSAARSASEHPT